MRARCLRILAFIGCSLALFAACGGSGIKPASAPATTAATTATPTAATAAATGAAAVTPLPSPVKTETVKVAQVPLMNFAPLYVAIDRGFFKEQGIEVDLQRVSAGTEAMPFLAQGQLDVGAIGLASSTFNAVHRGFNVKIVASAAIFPQTNSPTVLLLRKALQDNGQVKGVADLKGRKVAVAGTEGSAGAYLLARALQTGGLKPTDVSLVNLANPDIPAALQNGAVDAAVVGSPYSETAQQSGAAVTLLKDWLPGGSTTAYLYSAKFLQERPETALRFMVALIKGARAMEGSAYLSPENIATYVKYTGGKEATLKSTPPLVYDDLAVATASIADQEKVDRENGWTDYKDPLNVASLIASGIQQRAAALASAR